MSVSKRLTVLKRVEWDGSPEVHVSGARAFVPSREGGRWCATVVTLDSEVARAFHGTRGEGVLTVTTRTVGEPDRPEDAHHTPPMRYLGQMPHAGYEAVTEYHLFFAEADPGVGGVAAAYAGGGGGTP